VGASFRQSMTWLHTWAGVVLGGVLFAVFWMGTLSVFDREIDRWMMPETRLDASGARERSLDAFLPRVAGGFDAEAEEWWLRFPDERVPAWEFWYIDGAGEWQGPYWLHPQSGERLPDPETYAGTRFIYPFHYRLHLDWLDLGYWLVGLAAMAMLALLVSGVVVHRKIFREFFSFRPARRLQRSSLDLHNLTGVVGLPFHLLITLSGVIIFFNIYFPQAPSLAYAEAESPRAAFFEEGYGDQRREAAGSPGRLASLDAMLARAETRWSGSRASVVSVRHPGDANATVTLRRSYADTVSMSLDRIHFDGVTGEVLDRFEAGAAMSVQRFISGLHFIQFEHWVVRWLYFLLGLSGCVMIATGYVYWLEARRRRHAAQGLAGVRVVEGLTIGSVTGIIIATLAFFIANRLLPPGASFAGYERAALEVWVFYLTWLATFAHAWARPRGAGAVQSWVVAGMAVLAVALNAATTGDHLARTLVQGQWAVAGMDSLLLAGAGVAALTARKLQRRALPGAGASDEREPGLLGAPRG